MNLHDILALFDDLDVEGEGAEAVVAADHGAHGVLHPAVEEVAFAAGEGFDKWAHRLPGRCAQSLRSLSVNGHPLLPDANITGMADGILVLSHQVGVFRLADCGDTYFVQKVQ